MRRRFYVFNSEETVLGHIAQVKTLSDLYQLEYDISASETNLTAFKHGVDGVWAIDCCAGEKTIRHVFFTQEAFKQFGVPLQEEADSYSVLEVEG